MDEIETKALARIGVEISEEEPRSEWLGIRQIVRFTESASYRFDLLREMEDRMTTHGVAEHFPGYWILFGSLERVLRHLDGLARKHFGKSLLEIGMLESAEV